MTINGTTCYALLDSGNIWRSAISYDFFTSLGLGMNDIKRLKNMSVGTAKQGEQLDVIGEPTRPLTMTLQDCNTRFAFKPIIIRGLAMDVNISGPWMKSKQWDQLHSEDAIRVQGKTIKLERPKDILPTRARIKGNQTAAANSITLINLSLDEHTNNKEEGILHGSVHFMNTTDLHPGQNAAVTADNQGTIRAAVMNTTDKPIQMTDGTFYGHFATFNKFNIATVAPKSKQDKQKEYIQRLVNDKDKAKQKIEDDKHKTNFRKYTQAEREQWIIDQFKLKESPFLKTPQLLTKAVDTLMEFWDFFSHDGSFGKTDLIEHKIITEDVPPIKSKYRPPNPALEENLREQLKLWLDNDVIEPAESPWSFNLVAAKKKGGKIRWCVDWRRLNDITKKDTFPMPSVQDNITRLAGSKIFSAVDMEGAFHCINLNKADREKTAFATPFGSFQQKRLGFGLTNGPPTYCRLVERVLRDIPPYMAIGFLDDAVIHSTDIASHFVHLRKTLSAYRAAGLKLSPKKCTFFADKITYLGHELSKHGIKPTESYIKAIKDWQLPRFKTEARSFLGATGYYQDHIKDYAKMAKPWTDQVGTKKIPGTRKNDKTAEKTKLVVTDEMVQSFNDLKNALISAPVMGFPYFKGPKAGQFILDTDFCKSQIAAVLSQMQEGKEIVIAYASKKLNKHQINWPSTKGELYAGMHYMLKFAYYLKYGKEFLWRTDNVALKYIRTMQCPTNIIQRWLNTLADFNFKVEHRQGTKHCNADALSRANIADASEEDSKITAFFKQQQDFDISDDDEAAQEAPIHSMDNANQKAQEALMHATYGGDDVDGDAHLCAISTFRQRTLFNHTRDEIRRYQNHDEDLIPIRKALKTKRPFDTNGIRALSRVGKIYAGLLDSLHIGEDGIIRYSLPNQDNAVKRVICLPRDLWDDTIRIAHATGGHMASETTYHRLSRSVFFPAMRSEIQAYINTCTTCQKKSHGNKEQKHTLQSPTPGYPFERIHVDFVGPLNKGKRTKATYILTIKDAFSKWVEGIPLQHATAEETVRALEKEVFARYGIPELIVSDMGKQFESQLYKEVTKTLGIQISNTTGYNPKANGQVERMHRDLGAMLRAMTIEQPNSSWEDLLPQALFALRTARSSTTGLAPYHILFGRDASQPIDHIFGNPNGDEANEGESKAKDYVRELHKRINKAQTFARENLKLAVQRMRRNYHEEKKTFRVGAKVWLFTPSTRKGIPRKLTPYWTGPWTVCADNPVSPTMFRIAPHPSWSNANRKRTIVVSIDRLKQYRSSRHQEPDQYDDLLMEGDEFAESLNMDYGQRQKQHTDVQLEHGYKDHMGEDNGHVQPMEINSDDSDDDDDDDDDYQPRPWRPAQPAMQRQPLVPPPPPAPPAPPAAQAPPAPMAPQAQRQPQPGNQRRGIPRPVAPQPGALQQQQQRPPQPGIPYRGGIPRPIRQQRPQIQPPQPVMVQPPPRRLRGYRNLWYPPPRPARPRRNADRPARYRDGAELSSSSSEDQRRDAAQRREDPPYRRHQRPN